MNKDLLIDILLVVLVSASTFIVASVYVSHEHAFYFSDYAGHQDLTKAKTIEFRESPVRALYRTWRSTAGDYNEIPALLLVPLTLIFGDSRQVFILGLVLFYLLPFIFVLGAVAVKLIPGAPRVTYWLTVFVALLTPATWVPSLRGYPDTGGAVIMGLAVLVFLRDTYLKSRWQNILMGLLITGAILFRRHFIFGGFAFYLSVLVYSVIVFAGMFRKERQAALRMLSGVMGGLGLSVLATVASLVLIGFPFVRRLLTTDFGLLYASYKTSLGESLQFFGSVYGWVCWLLAAAGLAIAARSNVARRPVALFITMFGVLSVMVWLLMATQVGEQYSTHFTAFIVLGLVALCSTLLKVLEGNIRVLIPGAIAVFLAFNAGVGLGAVEVGNTALLSAPSSPLQHRDYAGIVRLIEYLHAVAGRGEPVYIAGSSDLFGCSVLTAADRTLYTEGQRLNILPCIHIDSRDEYPLEKLIQADYVVIATPYQLHLAPEEQRVVEVVVDAFTNDWAVAKDFTCLAPAFPLADRSVIVSVFKRTHPTSPVTAFNTLKAMLSYVLRRPGSQQSWIALCQLPNYYIVKSGESACDILLNGIAHPARFTATFLYIEKIRGRVRISGELSASGDTAATFSLLFAAVDTQAQRIKTSEVLCGPPELKSNFAATLDTKGADFLTLVISSQSEIQDSLQHPIVRISHLAVIGD